MNALQPQFNDTPVSIIDHNGKKWITSEQAGLCLCYAKDHARTSINKLYARHADEFTQEDSIEVKLASNTRGNPNTRIFSETGCIKLAFFANTKASKDFRHFASQALVTGERKPINQDIVRQLQAAQRELLRKSPRLREVKVLKQAGFNNCRIADMLRTNEKTVRRDVKTLSACGLEPIMPSQQIDLFNGAQEEVQL